MDLLFEIWKIAFALIWAAGVLFLLGMLVGWLRGRFYPKPNEGIDEMSLKEWASCSRERKQLQRLTKENDNERA
jgi:hypothetical protein